MKRLRAEFFAAGRAADLPCWICTQKIDYDADPGTTPDSHELDHYYPVSTHPELEEDPTNFRHSHRGCNAERSNAAPVASLGEPIPDWW